MLLPMSLKAQKRLIPFSKKHAKDSFIKRVFAYNKEGLDLPLRVRRKLNLDGLGKRNTLENPEWDI
jgi:hypothetical protein